MTRLCSLLVLVLGLFACDPTSPVPLPDAGLPGVVEPGDGGGGPVLPRACWPFDSRCDPRAGQCGERACRLDPSLARPTFACLPPGRGAGQEACTAESGCGAGLHCRDGVCQPLCCESTECRVAGEACVPFDVGWGSLGTCRVPPRCVSAGGTCVRSSECCSADCHFDHCH